jgi:hypothetical protein
MHSESLLLNLAVCLAAAAMISIIFNPFLFRNLPHIERYLLKLPRWQNA